ncbi:hypothetical protein [Paraglaciecola sp. 25GB23A]|uniref:hypothetical protein n=1 Tax=Paraglaciecola sp. 25GB23A TaxID=3156068 RepID=UPI0032AF86BA
MKLNKAVYGLLLCFFLLIGCEKKASVASINSAVLLKAEDLIRNNIEYMESAEEWVLANSGARLNGRGFPLNTKYMDIRSLDYQLTEKTHNLGIDFVALERHVATKIVKFTYVLRDDAKGYAYVRVVREGAFPSNHFETDCDKTTNIGVCEYKTINGWLIYTVDIRIP